MLRLKLVVELLGESLTNLRQHGTRVETRRKALDDRANEPEVAQIARHGFRHARVLNLDRHVVAVACPRTVHLAERRERERLLVDVGEQLPNAGAEILLDHASHATERHPLAPRRAVHRARSARRSPTGRRSSRTIDRNCWIFGPAPRRRPSCTPSSSASADARASSRASDRCRRWLCHASPFSPSIVALSTQHRSPRPGRRRPARHPRQQATAASSLTAAPHGPRRRYPPI